MPKKPLYQKDIGGDGDGVDGYVDDDIEEDYSFELDNKLHAFLASQGIPIDVNDDDDDDSTKLELNKDIVILPSPPSSSSQPILSSSSSQRQYINDDDGDSNNYHYNFDDDTNHHHHEQSMDTVELLMPSYTKINSILKERGYEPVTILFNDIHVDIRTISVYSVDVWAESILNAITEMVERSYNHQNAIQHASMSMKKGDVSTAALKTRVDDLQHKLYESEKREKALAAKIHELEEGKEYKIKKTRMDENDSKKLIKNLELQLAESERRVRQRDIENDRMREKLRMLSNKEKDTAAKHNITLSTYKQRPAKAMSPDKSKRTPSPSDIIDALEAQRTGLQSRVVELEEQVRSMSKSLRDIGYRKPPSNSNNKDVDGDIEDIENEEHNGNGNSKLLIARIEHLKTRQEELTSHYERLKGQYDDQIELNGRLQQEMQEVRDESDNLKLELESRPTVKRLKQKELEVESLEAKLHDLIMLRGESAEISSWRKHLQTSERIKIDKRNHELGLWLIEALPKTVMKETLQAVCRELDVTEISEIQPSLCKLKAAVRVIPRMEHFITQICEFVFSNDNITKNISTKPAIDDIFPIIKKWKTKATDCDDLIKFTNAIIHELHRRENLLANNDENTTTSIVFDDRKLKQNSISIIKELCDFQINALKNNRSFKAGDEYLKAKPDELVSQLMNHILYIFDIKELQGVLPKMNQLYIFIEEQRNFLSSMRDLLALKGASDHTVLSTISSTLNSDIQVRRRK